MPSGYTGGVADGKVTTLKEFAIACSTAIFGDDFNIKNVPEVEDYYWERARDAWETFKALESEDTSVLKALSFEMARDQAELDHKIRLSDNNKIVSNYQKMMKLVENWRVSSKLENLKRFMINQLNESINHDDISEVISPKFRFDWDTPDDYYMFSYNMAKSSFSHALSNLINEVYRIESHKEMLAEFKESL